GAGGGGAHAGAANARHASAAAGPHGAVAALEEVAAAVSGRAALDALLHAGQRRARDGAALAGDAAAAAGLGQRAVPALEEPAAAVAGRAALDVLRRAGGRRAHRHVGRHAGSEVEDHELQELLLGGHLGDAEAPGAHAAAALAVRRARVGVLLA